MDSMVLVTVKNCNIHFDQILVAKNFAKNSNNIIIFSVFMKNHVFLVVCNFYKNCISARKVIQVFLRF